MAYGIGYTCEESQLANRDGCLDGVGRCFALIPRTLDNKRANNFLSILVRSLLLISSF